MPQGLMADFVRIGFVLHNWGGLPGRDWVRFVFFGHGEANGMVSGEVNWVRFVFLGRPMEGVGQIGFVSHFPGVRRGGRRRAVW